MKNQKIRNNFWDLCMNLWNNVRVIFLVGVFFGTLFAAYHIVYNEILHDEYEIVYKTELSANLHYQDGKKVVPDSVCQEILNGEKVKKGVLSYLGAMDEYEIFKKNINVWTEDDKLLMVYYGYYEGEAKGIVSQIYTVFGEELKESGYISTSELKDDIKAERIRRKIDSGLKIGIGDMVQLGIICGIFIALVAYTLSYFVKGNIRDEIDIYKNFDLPVLANIPYIRNEEYNESDLQKTDQINGKVVTNENSMVANVDNQQFQEQDCEQKDSLNIIQEGIQSQELYMEIEHTPIGMMSAKDIQRDLEVIKTNSIIQNNDNILNTQMLQISEEYGEEVAHTLDEYNQNRM